MRDQKQQEIKQQTDAACTFNPKVRSMISEKLLNQIKTMSDANIPQAQRFTIPDDTSASREQFKKVPGMQKFLDKQFNAMCNKEELAMMKFNMGKTKEQKKSLAQWVNPAFAYANPADATETLQARERSLNSHLKAPCSQQKQRGQQAMQRFMRS